MLPNTITEDFTGSFISASGYSTLGYVYASSASLRIIMQPQFTVVFSSAWTLCGPVDASLCKAYATLILAFHMTNFSWMQAIRMPCLFGCDAACTVIPPPLHHTKIKMRAASYQKHDYTASRHRRHSSCSFIYSKGTVVVFVGCDP
jgi:hypothetical protein